MKLTIHNENIYVYLESITPEFRLMLLEYMKCKNNVITHSFEGREMVHVNIVETFIREYIPKATKIFWDFVNAFEHHNGIYAQRLNDALQNQITIKTYSFDFNVDLPREKFIEKITALNFKLIDSTRYFLKINDILQIEVDVYLKEISVFNYKAFFEEDGKSIDDFEFCNISKHSTLSGLLRKVEGFIKIIQIVNKATYNL